MIDRLKEKARGENAIGPWVSLSVWVTAKGPVRGDRGGGRALQDMASPQEIADAQRALSVEATARLGSHFLTGFAVVILDDMQPPIVQINARYQGFDGSVGAQPLSVQQVALIAPGKTRAIELE